MPAPLSELLAFGLTGSPWPLVVAWFLVVIQLTIHSVSLYLHRSATHRGVDFHPALAHAFRFWTWLTTGMVTREWVAIHRKHHARCETDGDPHSPVVHGIGTILWHGVALYQEARKDRAMVARYGIGTVDDWLERNLYARWSLLGPTLMLFIDLALFGAVGLVVWALQMLWVPVIAAGVINGLGHWWGYRNFETADRATNLVPWGIVIAGEELHNNHHAFPSSARFALRRWEFDSGWALLRLFEAVGLARVIRVAPALALRPNIALPDADTVRAVLAHRFHVMTSYYRLVLRPALEQERRAAGESMDRLTRRLRKALANDGRWLDEAARARLGAWIAERPSMQVLVEHRRRLGAAMERSGRNSQAMLESLQAWCADAERSGIATLAQFARTLRGYALVPARA